MMKKLFLLLLTSVFAYIGNTQTIIYEDDFESYTVGQGLAGQNTMWIVWPGGQDAPVVTEQAQSGTKSVKLFGDGDLVLPMGKISGKYQVDFYYYVPTGFGGYYNFQRLPSPGVEWVAEVYFANNGTGFIHAGGQNAATFNYPQNQWIHIKNIIDIDGDWGEIFINNTLIYGWQWSLTSAGGISPHGTQLGGLNIYAGAPPLQTATYFMDDFSFIELEEGNLPVIVVSPDEYEVDVPSGQTATDDLLVENDGTAALNYSIEANYVFSSMKNVPIKDYQEPIEELSGCQHKNNIDMIVDMPDSPDKVSYSPPKDDYLTYAGPNATGVGFTDPIIFEVAARFPNSITLPYAGMQLTQVNVYLYHTDNCTFRIKVYGEGSDFEPGDVYVDQLFSTSLPGEYQITLVNPITITGEDLWIGYRVVQGLGGIFPIGADAGPANPNGHFIKPGAGWSVSNQDRNWNISGVLTGQGITQWLSFSPATGTIDPNDDEVHTVNFDASNLAMGEYEAILKLKSNDIINPLVTIPVTLNVGAGIQDPTIQVNPTSMTEMLPPDATSTKNLNIKNIGLEDLTFNISLASPPVSWLSALPLSGTLTTGQNIDIAIGFDATGLTYDDYQTTISISSNDPSNPVVVIPVTLTVADMDFPAIVVNPLELTETIFMNMILTQEMTIANEGTGTLDYDLEIEYVESLYPETIIIDEGFEGAFPPAGWIKMNPDGGTGWALIGANVTPIPGWTGGNSDPAPNGGNYMVFCTWTTGGATANDQWIVTPQVNVSGETVLSFWLRYWPDSYPDLVEIKLSTTVQNNAGAFNIMIDALNFSTGSSMVWEYYEYKLSDFVAEGTNVYIGFREYVADNNNDGAAIFLDNVMVYKSLNWLAVNPSEGSVEYMDEDIITVTFNSAGLDKLTYNAKIIINSNDPDDPQIEVPVTLDVVTGINDQGEPNAIMIYPNPASDFLHISANHKIGKVHLYSIDGLLILSQDTDKQKATISTKDIRSGLYILKVESEAGSSNTKIIIK